MENQQIQNLIQILGNEDITIFLDTVDKLKQFGEVAVIELINVLKSSNNLIRSGAVSALALIGNKKAVEPLIEKLLDNCEDGSVRVSIAWRLWLFNDLNTVEPLIKVLKDQNGLLRAKAICSLGLLGDQRAVEPLIETLNDENQEARFEAGRALGEIRSPNATQALIEALQDRSNIERWIFAEALGNIGDARSVEALIRALNDEVEEVAVEASKALVVVGKAAVLPVISLLKNTNSDLRWWAVIILGYIKDERAIAPLKEVLHDEDPTIRERATKAIETIQQ